MGAAETPYQRGNQKDRLVAVDVAYFAPSTEVQHHNRIKYIMSPVEHSAVSDDTHDWPDACYRKYERVHVLGKGSFGQVWMSRRKIPPKDEFDDEYVAIKAIQIKNDKSKIYAEREIRILQELRHPNVIRLIQDFPLFSDTRVVVMQLALGPNLHQLIVKRGALGLPLCRLVCRQLIAAVGYSTFSNLE